MSKKKLVPLLHDVHYIDAVIDPDGVTVDCNGERAFPLGYIPRSTPFFSRHEKFFYYTLNDHECRFISYHRYQTHVHAEVYFILQSADISILVVDYVPPNETDFISAKRFLNVVSVYDNSNFR